MAVGDTVTGIVSPVGVVEVPIERGEGRDLLDAIVAAVDEQVGAVRSGFGRVEVAELVVGLPVNMDGTEGPRAKLVRGWAERLRERTGRVVHVQDERLTSSEADWTLAGSGFTRKQKKMRRDAIAAAAILRDFLEMRKAGRGEAEG